MFELRSVPDDELAPYYSDEVYTEIARQFRFDILGAVGSEEPEKDFDGFREDIGTLHRERWKCLKWKRPNKESAPCWWLTNPHDEDRTQPPKLLSCSLATLKLELQQQCFATTSKHLR